MQPLNSNSLFECVKLGECTPPNHTNSALYHNGRLLVNFYAEAKDCAEYHVHGSEGNLPQSPDCRSYCSRPRGKKLIGNAVNAPHLHSTPTMSGRVVHKNLNSPIVVLGSSSHYYRHSVLKKSCPRSKIRGTEHAIDLFGYSASLQTWKAFKARLKTLVRFHFRDVHLSWTKESVSFQFLIEALLEQFPKASWDDGVVSKSVSGI